MLAPTAIDQKLPNGQKVQGKPKAVPVCPNPPSPSTTVEDHCRLSPNALGKHSRAIPSIYRSHFCPVRVCFVCFAFACNLRTQRDIALRVVGPATTFSGSPCSGRASEKRHVPCNGSNCNQHTQDTEWENALGFPLARFFFLFLFFFCHVLSLSIVMHTL